MRPIPFFALFWAALAIAPASLTACASSRPLTEQTDDMRVAARVGQRLIADPTVERFAIDIDVVDGVVTLRGEVDDEQSADAAVEIARTTAGVERVIDKLRIASGDEPLADDLVIRAEVGTRLIADPDVRRFDVDVDVVDGVVYLSGVVPDRAAKQAAERIARGVAGVRRVDNELTIRAPVEQR